MKIGLLGDIHGNADALEKVLAKAEERFVERLLVTGDLVGYYFEPKRVLTMLEGWSYSLVRGNHEEMLGRGLRSPAYLVKIEAKYGSGIRVAIEQLNEQLRATLISNPISLDIKIGRRNIILCHGVPGSCDTYFFPDSDTEVLGAPDLQNIDLVVMGHTHHPMLRKDVADTLFVNPGSVGQPRNGNPGAHWAIYDTESGVVDFQVEPYDYSRVQEAAKRRHPELPYLSDIFERR